MSVNGSRRDFLFGAGIAAVAAGLDPAAVSAQEAQAPHAAIPLEVVDFHSHFVGPAFTSRAGAAAPAAQKARWDEVNRNLSDPETLLSSIDAAGVSARVVNTPLEFIRGSDGEIPADADRRANDQLAELAGRNAGRLHGLATVDAYGGDAGAQELNRAVRPRPTRRLRRSRPEEFAARRARSAPDAGRGRQPRHPCFLPPHFGPAAARAPCALRCSRNKPEPRNDQLGGAGGAPRKRNLRRAAGPSGLVTTLAIGGVLLAEDARGRAGAACRHARAQSEACLHLHNGAQPDPCPQRR